MTSDQESHPASFYASPQEARDARPEELLYLACLHEGTGVDRPDFLAVVDAQQGRVVHETPMPNVGDELHPLRLESLQLGVPRARSLASDRPRLPLVADPRAQRRRRPAPA